MALHALAILALSAGGPAYAQTGEDVRTFEVDAQASEIRITVYRAGLLSGFSHDHILIARGLAGRILYHPALIERSSLQLSIPVDSIEVDAPEEREKEGLSGTVDEEDRQSIRETMLGAEFLDGALHPRVAVTADVVSGTLPLLGMSLNLRIKQTEGKLTVPVEVHIEGDTLRATGDVTLLQSDYGLEPFSDWGGLVAVKDEIRVQFKIVAHEQP